MSILDGHAVGTGEGGTGSRPALGRCTTLPAATFARDVWARTASLSRAADLAASHPGTPAAFGDLFDLDAADHVLSRQGLRTPFLRMAKNGSTLPASAFTAGGGVGATISDQVDPARVAALFADGATVVLQALHRTHAPIEDFARRLVAELGHPVQVNAYVTPPQSRGFDDHYDVHDVFVLQVAGTKRWRIHEPVHPAPLRDEPWTDRAAAVREAAAGPCVLDVVLEPGDALYLPRGWLHAATALGDVSAHLTVGVHVWTRRHVLDALLDEVRTALAAEEAQRVSLPLGVDVADAASLADDVDAVVARLRTALSAPDTAAVARRLGASARAGTRPEPVAPFAQARAVRRRDPGAAVRARAGVDLARLVQVAPGASADALDRLRRGDVVTSECLGVDEATALLAAGLLVPA